MEVDGEPRVLTMMHDVTEHVRLQDELRQSQKMEAVGRLAGGVAHDFNNLLTALSGYNSLLLAALPADDARRGFAERVAQAAERASALTNQLLAFSRKQPVAIEDLDVNEVIRSTTDMLRRLIGEDVELVSELAPRARPRARRPRADRAGDREPGGQRARRHAARRAHHADARPTCASSAADFVRFAVRDTGVGIDAQTRARLFEPFYTTKGPGKGTGLGLATVYGIVKQAGGQVRVESEPGHGALFEVLLPRSTTSAAARRPAAEPVEPPRGRGTILLVEDDESVRDFVGFVLRQQGYEVLRRRAWAARARDRRSGYDGEIDLLISDVVMPHMERLRRGRGAAPRRARRCACLHISGYPGDGVTGDAAFLAKPFSRETLLERVAELIARSPVRLTSARGGRRCARRRRSSRRRRRGRARRGRRRAARGPTGSACPCAPRGRSRPSARARPAARETSRWSMRMPKFLWNMPAR